MIRGMCVLRPGIPGVSETINVRSVVGRFLEHSRIYVFANGGDREVFISSADLMGRNLDRRVELGVPVLDRAIADTIDAQILQLMLRDNVKSRELLPDGSYRRIALREGDAGPPFDSQSFFLKRAQAV
jgi:polyphosphate kinase